MNYFRTIQISVSESGREFECRIVESCLTANGSTVKECLEELGESLDSEIETSPYWQQVRGE